MKLFNYKERLEKKEPKLDSEKLQELTKIISKNFGKNKLSRIRPNFVCSKQNYVPVVSVFSRVSRVWVRVMYP